jgi:hydrogenase maturation protein HypF
LSVGPQVFISQHIGDLDTQPADRAFRRVIEDFQKLYDVRPSIIAADAHPDYLSTRFAGELARSRPGSGSPFRNAQLLLVPHHQAHVYACMAENELEPPVLGVSWDGTGYGLDGTIWGGEWFRVSKDNCRRAAHLRQFRLPGGEAAVKEPRRVAAALLWEIFGPAGLAMDDLAPLQSLKKADRITLGSMLKAGLNSPQTSSVGRLFDAVAALCGLRQQTQFEGQTAMALEFALEEGADDEAYEFAIRRPAGSETLVVDWAPMIEVLLGDIRAGVARGTISGRFHNGLAEAIVEVAKRMETERVALSGGCFQNRYLTERSVRRLREEGFRPYWHQRIPPNDGGIALGQVAAALHALR